jgi:hypothetical protein
MGKYLAAAFANPWNLLVFVAGMGAAVISGYPEIAVPSVLAAEAVYLGAVSMNPRFRNYVNVHEAETRRRKRSVENEKVVRRILRELPSDARDRYEQLRKQCAEMRDIAGDLRQPGREEDVSPLDTMQLEGLDRLLWIHLRLLYTRHALARFLDDAQVDLIHKDIERLENRLQDLSAGGDRPQSEKVRRTLEDNLATCRARLGNYQKARDNYEYIELEIDRLENKIRSLAEAGVRPHEPNFVSSHIDEMAGSLIETEKTMDELEFATGLGHLAAEPPEMLEPTRVVEENRFG